MKDFSTYYGGQNGSGHYQILINHVPVHDIHIEGFLGMSGIFKNMSMPAGVRRYGFDLDKEVVDWWNKCQDPGDTSIYVHSDYAAAGIVLSMLPANARIFIHFDPPYRKTRSPLKYKHKPTGDNWYMDMLDFIALNRGENIYWMVSHWKDDLFDQLFKFGFHHVPFKTISRAGLIDNGIYVNYDITQLELACFDYVGSGYTDRQRIKRKVGRMAKKVMSMSAGERGLLYRELGVAMQASRFKAFR